MESDPESSKWKPVFTRLMAILQHVQAQVDAERQSVDSMNEFYRQFNSLPAAEETKEDQASTPQMDVAQAKQKLLDYLEKADTVLVKARSLRQADSGDGTSKNKRHTTKITNPSTVASKKIDDHQPDKPQVVTRTTVPKQGARSRSRSVVTVRKVAIARDKPRSTSQSRSQKQHRQPSPPKKSDKIAYREMLSSAEVQAQLREFSALVDEARKCTATNAECPERAQFLALYGSGETAADGKSSKNELSPVLTSPTFPSLEELRREFDAYIEKKCASLDKFVLDFCAESVVPLLESTTCPDKEYAAVVQAFYGIICNKGRRLPAFVKPDQ
ncbi:uncharacterized protein LOC119180011 [Rhipicephalus microplus]|uniref:uncharacterized protein LOC119180011 n=1 Tax=Rhipicephalus microplus TaxID=6941 RepID=UPI003F6A7E90